MGGVLKKITKISSYMQNKNLQRKCFEICRKDYDKGNESVTDFSYAMALEKSVTDSLPLS